MNRDLDAKIARDIFGWKYVQIGKDYDGKNECKILNRTLKIDNEILSILPFRGIINEAYLVPLYSHDLYLSLELAKYVKLDISIKDLPLDPEKIAQLSYDYYIKRKKKKDLINIIINILKEKYPKITFINAMEESVNGISLPDDYTIVALNVPIRKNLELQEMVYDNIFKKLIENQEELPCFIPINKSKVLRGKNKLLAAID
jgi:hypothetical protein